MSERFQIPYQRVRAIRWLLPVLIAGVLAGCAAMEGVNVGASLPVGIGRVGMNKTVGQGQPPAPRQQKPAETTDESADEKAADDS